MGTDRLLKHAFIADRRLKPELSWCLRLEDRLKGHFIPSPADEQPNHRHFSLASAQSQHIEQLSLESSSKGVIYRQIKLGYACEPYIQQANNSHLRRIIAQFCAGSHWQTLRLDATKSYPGKIGPAQSAPSSSQTQGYHSSAGMPLIQMMRAADRLRMSIMLCLIAQAMYMPESISRIFSKARSPLSASL